MGAGTGEQVDDDGKWKDEGLPWPHVGLLFDSLPPPIETDGNTYLLK